MARFVIIGNSENRRVIMFQAALAKLNLPAATVVNYCELLAGKTSITPLLDNGTIVRIESPGENSEVERGLIALGADVADPLHCAKISRDKLVKLSFEHGRIYYPRQWYLGFSQLLTSIEQQLKTAAPHRLMNTPTAIKLMFDKPACQAHLISNNLPSPPSLGSISCYDELIDRMLINNCLRVFIKLAHSSSASGVLAYRTNRNQHQAITTVEMINNGGEIALYNSLKIQRYNDQRAIATIIDQLARHNVQVERWLPKAQAEQGVFDLRVLVIGGQARHTVARISQTPITNLHLLNKRGDCARLQAIIGEQRWQAAMADCQRAAKTFDHNLYAGIDLMFTPKFRQHFILEANAFGDLLPAVLNSGVDSYQAEIAAMIDQEQTC